MASNGLSTFLVLVPWLVIFGLFLDIVGAMILLGPEVDKIAKLATRWERDRLHGLIDRVESGETIDETYSGFDNLRIAVGQRYWQGETALPARLEDVEPDDLFYNFEVVEPRDEGIYLRNYSDTRGFGYNVEGLRRDANNFTATARLYYSQGGFALVSGFYLQIVGAISEIKPIWSMWAFILGGGVLVYMGIRMMD